MIIIITHLGNWPIYKIVTLNNKKYFLVHGSANTMCKDLDICYRNQLDEDQIKRLLWDSYFRNGYNSMITEYDAVITGHVKVTFLNTNKVVKKDNYYDIDGGLASHIKCNNPVTLFRLDDHKVYNIYNDRIEEYFVET